MMDQDFNARVERAAMALERMRKSDYEWSDELFDTWFNRDPQFVSRVTSRNGFIGTQKEYLFMEVALVLRAAGDQ